MHDRKVAKNAKSVRYFVTVLLKKPTQSEWKMAGCITASQQRREYKLELKTQIRVEVTIL